VASKRGRTLTSFGQFFWSITGAAISFVPIIPTATGKVFTPVDEGQVKVPTNDATVSIPQDAGKVKSYGPT
jgi:hypothetical protein